MNTPSDLKYSREHEWVRAEGDSATVGITDFAQEELGDIVFLQLPEPGTQVDQLASMGEIESVKSVSELFSPVSGEVVEQNAMVREKPELVNTDPYGDGWLVKVRMADTAQLENLLSAEEYVDL